MNMNLAKALIFTHCNMILEGAETDWTIADGREQGSIDEKFRRYFNE